MLKNIYLLYNGALKLCPLGLKEVVTNTNSWACLTECQVRKQLFEISACYMTNVTETGWNQYIWFESAWNKFACPMGDPLISQSEFPHLVTYGPLLPICTGPLKRHEDQRRLSRELSKLTHFWSFLSTAPCHSLA